MPNAPKQSAPVHNLKASYPKSRFPLKQAGQETYDEWCEKLANKGLLSATARQHVENLALATDQMTLAIESGKNFRSASELLRSSTLKLEKMVGHFDLDTDTGSTPQGENPFTAFGFAKRAKERRHS